MEQEVPYGIDVFSSHVGPMTFATRIWYCADRISEGRKSVMPAVYNERNAGELRKGETPESYFIQIQAAYELLMNRDQRRQYDLDHRTNPLKVKWHPWIRSFPVYFWECLFFFSRGPLKTVQSKAWSVNISKCVFFTPASWGTGDVCWNGIVETWKLIQVVCKCGRLWRTDSFYDLCVFRRHLLGWTGW